MRDGARVGAVSALMVLAAACASRALSNAGADPPLTGREPTRREPVRAPGALGQKLAEARSQDAEHLLQAHALPFAGKLSYEPTKALGMDRIQKSSVALSPGEEALLASNGFSISDARQFPTFTYGYASLYAEHLPLYVSADSLLHAVHKSYDKILQRIEMGVLIQDVRSMLGILRTRLGAGALAAFSPETRADVDLFLAVGLGLLEEKPQVPVAGAEAAKIDRLTAQGASGEGSGRVDLFGKARDVDFSQFKPRGHYNTYGLQSYFKAMMWFGRTDFRLLEPQRDGSLELQRRQLDAALALATLFDGEATQRYERIDRVVSLFVGEHDSMTLPDMVRLRKELEAGGPLASQSDARLKQVLQEGGYGAQRIASQMLEGGQGQTLTLPRVFQLMGQRYTVDSHVFSNVTYDRIPTKRMMPSTLDVAFGALGNDHAAALLAPELKAHPYAPDLATTRVLIDEHEPAYWESSLYTLWVSSIRALSPAREELKDAKKAGLPAVATTEAWSRRMLNTQLASWAELRHDTLLYAKQSYTGMAACEFPDAYVEPYPEFFRALGLYAERGRQMMASLGKDADPQARAHFELLQKVAAQLQGMAERQRQGKPFSAEQMAFINDAVVLKTEPAGCTSITTAKGWYPSLILDDPLDYDPTIADVHTQPTDEGGATVGRVLHVGTGTPRRLIVTADTCQGPRAYVGLVSSYSEKITSNFQRLDDQQWAAEYRQISPPPTPWMAPLIAAVRR